LDAAADFLSVLTDADALQLLLFACPDGVIVSDESENVVLYTGAAEAIFGFAPVDVMTRPLAQLFASRADYERFKARLATDGWMVNAEVGAARKDAPAFTAAISASRLRDRYGAELGAVMYVRDYTRVRAIEDTLRDSNRRLNDLVGNLDHVARHDGLTGLLNRASAIGGIESYMLSADPDTAHYGVALFDIDHFKSVNDSYGHLVGDEVLAWVAKVLRTTARQSDLVGRFGGEEFIVFLPGADLVATQRFAERVRSAVEHDRVRIDDDLSVGVQISGGVASVPDGASNLADAIRLADDRLLEAKRAGRNQIRAGDGPAERKAA
jgi:diguanylate cyclase (GGDEF)-like protein/PAS domain S-box-containing protein